MKIANVCLYTDRRIRLAAELVLLIISAVHFSVLGIMHAISPISDVLPMLSYSFAIPMVIALVSLHFIP